MEPLRLFPIVALVSIPTVMFGGYALLRFLTRGEGLSEFKLTYFRAGHAHAGVLLILALVYFDYLERTDLGDRMRWSLGVALVVGILAQSGGFFLHMAVGAPGRRSAGTTVTIVGAAILAVAILVLAYGLAVAG
jgi:Ni,Fe-hydrogenase I cytochrome b subunit